jgi:hypothetical protein
MDFPRGVSAIGRAQDHGKRTEPAAVAALFSPSEDCAMMKIRKC